MVARFSTSPPNPVLMKFAKEEQRRTSGRRLLDIGCGAGSNAIPLARLGWNVLGIDRSEPMLAAARNRALDAPVSHPPRFIQATMDRLPVEDRSFDFIVAHGIWNLAGSSAEFRSGIREAGRAARPGAALFIYTFSRSTFPSTVAPIEGEPFVFTEFSGRPQCFLTEEQLIGELGNASFDQETPITKYDAIPGGKPSIYEAVFRKR